LLTKRLSYDLHDGHELELMLAGRKPLSFFYEDADIPCAGSAVPEADFDRYVKTGIFCKGETVISGSIHPRTGRPVRTRYVFYSTKAEQWRITAMILVLKTMLRTERRPDEGLDRMTGSLLGYTDEQNDEYISAGCYQR